MVEEWLDWPISLYRKKHNLVAGEGGDLTNYQMALRVHYASGVDSDDDVYLDGKCNTDFSDLRFTSEDSLTVYDYWLKAKVDSDYADFIIEVADDLASNQAMQVYYGNPSASSLSNQADTFIDVISGVVGAWTMDEALATDPVVDYSGNGNDGTPTGTTVVAGKFAGKNARSFGVGNYIQVADSASMRTTGDWTRGLWVYSNTVAAGDGLVHDFWVLRTTTNKFLLRVAANGSWRLLYRSTGAGFTDQGLVNKAQVWTFILVVKEGTNIKIYQDNAAPISVNNAENFPNDSHLTTFGGWGVAQTFNGITDIPLNFNYALTSTQGSNLYSNYGDPTLEAGKVLVRKWATITQPTHGSWEAEEEILDWLRGLITLDGDANPPDVVQGKTFYKDDAAAKLTGTLTLIGDANPENVLATKTFYKDNPHEKLTGTATFQTTMQVSKPEVIREKSELEEPLMLACAALLLDKRARKKP